MNHNTRYFHSNGWMDDQWGYKKTHWLRKKSVRETTLLTDKWMSHQSHPPVYEASHLLHIHPHSPSPVSQALYSQPQFTSWCIHIHTHSLNVKGFIFLCASLSFLTRATIIPVGGGNCHCNCCRFSCVDLSSSSSPRRSCSGAIISTLALVLRTVEQLLQIPCHSKYNGSLVEFFFYALHVSSESERASERRRDEQLFAVDSQCNQLTWASAFFFLFSSLLLSPLHSRFASGRNVRQPLFPSFVYVFTVILTTAYIVSLSHIFFSSLSLSLSASLSSFFVQVSVSLVLPERRSLVTVDMLLPCHFRISLFLTTTLTGDAKRLS